MIFALPSQLTPQASNQFHSNPIPLMLLQLNESKTNS